MNNPSNYFNEVKKYVPAGVFFACIATIIIFGEISPTAIRGISSNFNNDAVFVDSVAAENFTNEPAQLNIPSLSLQARFSTPLGITDTYEVEVPEDYSSVGWYKHSPSPGEIGPAVVLGHVDSHDGPAIFYSIGQLDVGDDIIITLVSGEEILFRVTENERYEQSSFPTELVYSDLDHSGLRLITCSGWYDSASNRYSHNRVVFAERVI